MTTTSAPDVPVIIVTAGSPVDRRAYFRELWGLRGFISHLARGNISARNARTALGMLWWLVNPLIMTAVYFVAFGLILGGSRGNPAYLAHLISGIFVLRFVSQSITGSINQIVGNAKLVVNSRFPRLALPIAANLEALFGLLVGLGAFYLLVMPLNGIYPGPELVLLPVAVLLTVLFALGVSSLIARIAVPYRDVQNLVPHLMRIWLYMSPVLWTIDRIDTIVAEGRTWVGFIEVNPLFSFLSLYRTALLGTPFEVQHLVISSFWAVAILILGVSSFIRADRQLARYL